MKKKNNYKKKINFLLNSCTWREEEDRHHVNAPRTLLLFPVFSSEFQSRTEKIDDPQDDVADAPQPVLPPRQLRRVRRPRRPPERVAARARVVLRRHHVHVGVVVGLRRQVPRRRLERVAGEAVLVGAAPEEPGQGGVAAGAGDEGGEEGGGGGGVGEGGGEGDGGEAPGVGAGAGGVGLEGGDAEVVVLGGPARLLDQRGIGLRRRGESDGEDEDEEGGGGDLQNHFEARRVNVGF